MPHTSVNYVSVWGIPRSIFKIKMNLTCLASSRCRQNSGLHCKKSWRSSSTPASVDAGPIHTGVEKSFRHPWRKFYYKYRTYCLQMSNFFDRAWIFQKQHRLGSNIHSLLLYHCATLTLCKMSYIYCIYTVYEPYARRGVGKSSR
jgi:hypothetical protein